MYISRPIVLCCGMNNMLYLLYRTMLVNSIPGFVAYGIIVSERSVRFKPIFCASPNSIFLPSFMCRDDMVSEFCEINWKKEKKKKKKMAIL